jgi:hypothetical protein
MCRLTKCRKCGKITWAGCGMHLDGLFNGIEKKDICACGPGG